MTLGVSLAPTPQGKVIKGWDVGVATMKRGEKAKFTISSDYAYGASTDWTKEPGVEHTLWLVANSQ